MNQPQFVLVIDGKDVARAIGGFDPLFESIGERFGQARIDLEDPCIFHEKCFTRRIVQRFQIEKKHEGNGQKN